MPIPDYESLMLPFLRILEDGQEHSRKESSELIARKFQLTEDDLREMTSGRQSVFSMRLSWAKAHLTAAGLIELVRSGFHRITDTGAEVLISNPSRIDLKFLHQHTAYGEYMRKSRQKKQQVRFVSLPDQLSQPPVEVLTAVYQSLRDALAAELLERILRGTPLFFEQLVLDLLVAMGYGGSIEDVRRVGRSGDGGIDGIINEDKLGLDVIHVQAKRWQNTVQRPDVQAFAGSLDGVRARKGVMITTSQFSQGAHAYVKMIEKKSFSLMVSIWPS